jgi:hypothetical protein
LLLLLFFFLLLSLSLYSTPASAAAAQQQQQQLTKATSTIHLPKQPRPTKHKQQTNGCKTCSRKQTKTNPPTKIKPRSNQKPYQTTLNLSLHFPLLAAPNEAANKHRDKERLSRNSRHNASARERERERERENLAKEESERSHKNTHTQRKRYKKWAH